MKINVQTRSLSIADENYNRPLAYTYCPSGKNAISKEIQDEIRRIGA